ncbi:type VI secretion system contractile sheath small subunit [Salmonella enterica subsp. enterica]|nr:type VI secretion system contractile sheath small subunit [Salmonella enterica subsp. enterica serovar Redlands]
MAESTFQSEIPKARVNIQLDLHTGSAQKKVELPLKILALGDFSNGKENRPVSERSPININKNNFDSVLSELNPNVTYAVQNTLLQDGSEENVKLNFSGIKDFEPEAVARQMSE